MSGVYIKGMEMPLACSNCAFCEQNYFYTRAYCRISDDDDMMSINEIRAKRRDNCPLVPVPPHGRLIDADVLIGTERETFEDYHISEAPTIIPAEEGE